MEDQVYLEYVFMFCPSPKTWTNLFQFENDLNKFLTDRGLDVSVVKTIEGQAGRRIILIAAKQEPMMEEEKKTKEKPVSVGEKIKSLAPEHKMSAAEKAFRNRRK